MTEINKVIILGVITSLLGAFGYLVKDYIDLKESEILRKEQELTLKITQEAYAKLDSLHNAEMLERDKYKKYVKKILDSLSYVSTNNREMTQDAIILLEDNEFKITQNERDSIYNVLNGYAISKRPKVGK